MSRALGLAVFWAIALPVVSLLFLAHWAVVAWKETG